MLDKETQVTIYTTSEDYRSIYKGEYLNYFQIHIYSMPEIISTYYNPKTTTLDVVKKNNY